MPAQILLFAVNLLPLVGVAFWGWDAFELLVLYWCETAVIAFWTIVQVVFMPARLDAFLSPVARSALGGVGRAIFLSVHAGIFMTVHMVFLWALFGSEWHPMISGPASFIQKLIVENGLWVPLLCTFAVRGVLTILSIGGLSPEPMSEKTVVHDLYRRIIVLQLTIIAGGWMVQLIGSRIGLVVLIGLKIAIDLLFDPFAKARRETV
jgi:hypothetical protein